MSEYTTFTTVPDNGPYITGLILHLGRTVRASELPEACFNVYTEWQDGADGAPVTLFEWLGSRSRANRTAAI